MTLDNLENLVKVKQLKVELPDQIEFNGMLKSAKSRLHDSQIKGLSEDSKFYLAYGSAHALALATMRWHGYRSDNRYKCHKQRNLAEYEGYLEITPQLLQELIDVTGELLNLAEALGPVNQKQ